MPSVSFVKSVEAELWSPGEIALVKQGGNENFLNLMKEYGIPQTKDFQNYKYYTFLAKYYREKINTESKGDVFLTPKPIKKDAIKVVDEYYNTVNEAENFQDNRPSENPKDYDIEEEFNNVAFSLSNIFNRIGKNISDSFKDNGFEDSIKSVGESAFSLFGNTKKTSKKSQGNSSIFDGFQEKAKEGFEMLSSKANEMVKESEKEYERKERDRDFENSSYSAIYSNPLSQKKEEVKAQPENINSINELPNNVLTSSFIPINIHKESIERTPGYVEDEQLDKND